jgi:hypothetical protein
VVRIWILLCGLIVGGCNCFQPVVECGRAQCRPDSGADAGRDAGVDGGRDAGLDGGSVACAASDGGGIGKCAAVTGYVATGSACSGACVEYPILAPGLFPDLASCVGCGGCDKAKFPSGAIVNPTCSCPKLIAKTTSPALLAQAFPGYDAGCTASGALGFECTLWAGSLGIEGYARACGATLVPQVTEVLCSTAFVCPMP